MFFGALDTTFGKKSVKKKKHKPDIARVALLWVSLYTRFNVFLIFPAISMKLSFSWLRDHLDTPLSAHDLEKNLMSLGIEVSSVEDGSSMLKSFSVGRIMHVKKHPSADRLSVCRVALPDGDVQIVCGAPNVRVGLKGIVAPPGTLMPALGRTIEKVSIRGVESHGMLCSYEELGLDERMKNASSGIADLGDDVPLDEDVARVLGLDDTVFSLDITPNRPDLLSVYGLARELSVADVGDLNPLSTPSFSQSSQEIGRTLTITPETKEGCPSFALALLKNDQGWGVDETLAARLQKVGMSSQGMLVDVTNHSMMDTGRPLHVFDADVLEGDLTLRLSEKNEPFEALNGKTYTLQAGHMVLADARGVVSLLGVMGGARGAVTPYTRAVLLESAYFEPSWISRAARHSHLITEASLRFERGVDPCSVLPGLYRATQRLVDAGGVLKGIVSCGKPYQEKPSFVFDPREIQRLSGVSVDNATVFALCEKMGLAPEDSMKTGIRVTPPSWRFDITSGPCLVEEVLRFKGYDHIPTCPLPTLSSHKKGDQPFERRPAEKAKSLLVASGLREVVTWSFISQDKAASCAPEDQLISLANPCSDDMSVMRPSLLPGLLSLVHQHQTRSLDMGLGVFEVGHIYRQQEDHRQRSEAAFVMPPSGRSHWYDQPHNVWQAKAVLLKVLQGLGVRDTSFQIHEGGEISKAYPSYHPKQMGVVRQGKKTLAVFGALHPDVLNHYGVVGPVYGADMVLDRLSLRSRLTAPPLPSPFQRVQRDLGFLVPDTLSVGTLCEAVRKALGSSLVFLDVFDVFVDPALLGEGKQSVAVRLTLQPHDAPADEAWLAGHMDKAVEAVKPLGAVLRRDAVA
ncbi:phenylalanine--tRNA ligase subunit beta [bacterium NHP-B]|nr:phenylalanine--tRNA ligase subunit beta [bacterium NHP-B]